MKVAITRWRSLDRKLPLLIAAAILATVVVFSASAYQLVQHVLLASAGERLMGASAPIAVSLARSTRQQRYHYARMAEDPAIAKFLLTGEDREAALRALARGSERDSLRPPARIELRTGEGEVVLDTVQSGAPGPLAWIDRVIQSGAAKDGETRIAPVFAAGDTAVGGSVVAVTAPAAGGEAGESEAQRPVIGYIAETRAIRARGVQQIRELLGNGAALFVGSPDEGTWTDLEHPAAPPPAKLSPGTAILYDSSVRGPGVGAATRIDGTPWLLWVEQPRAAVLAPLTDLLGKLAILAALCVIGGALAAWALSRQVTRPIVALAKAADRVAADSDAAPAEPRPGDEVARLTDAFARMAARVAESRGQLEGLVAERTARLEAALRDLELAQEELVKKERLAMLGQLASAVGHELRNPLGVMTNAMYVIEQCSPESSPPLVREYIDIVRGQIAISERIVGDLLDTARVRTPEAQAVDLRELVEQQTRRLQPTTTLTVDARIPENLPPVQMDPVQLSQILFNLMTNAAQAMGDGGSLTIAAVGDGSDRRVKLSLTDTGPGIPPETLDRIFEPLFTTKARGLGLGLWVSRNLAKANGATLTVDSRPGEGATFTLDMPTALEASTTTS
jgi:signal transduction histidine kinase